LLEPPQPASATSVTITISVELALTSPVTAAYFTISVPFMPRPLWPSKLQ
jgi:hypothetical protein